AAAANEAVSGAEPAGAALAGTSRVRTTAKSELPGGVPPIVKDEDIKMTPVGGASDAGIAPSAASASARARNPGPGCSAVRPRIPSSQAPKVVPSIAVLPPPTISGTISLYLPQIDPKSLS